MEKPTLYFKKFSLLQTVLVFIVQLLVVLAAPLFQFTNPHASTWTRIPLLVFMVVSVGFLLWRLGRNIPAQRAANQQNFQITLEDDGIHYYLYPDNKNHIPYPQIRYVELKYDVHRYTIYNSQFIIEYTLSDKPNPELTANDIETVILDLDNLDIHKTPLEKPTEKIFGKQVTFSNQQFIFTMEWFEAELKKRCPNINRQFSKQALIDKAKLEQEKQKTRAWLDSFKK